MACKVAPEERFPAHPPRTGSDASVNTITAPTEIPTPIDPPMPMKGDICRDDIKPDGKLRGTATATGQDDHPATATAWKDKSSQPSQTVRQSVYKSQGTVRQLGSESIAQATWTKKTVTLRRVFRPVLKSKMFRGTLVICLAFALFGGAIWNILDIPDEPGNVILDALMMTVMVLFAIEVVLCCIVDHREYPFSSFFFMDILGTISMIFEVSFMLGESGKVVDNDSEWDGVLFRAARAAKVTTRIGRLSKIMKCLSTLGKPAMNEEDESIMRGPGARTAQAKVLSGQLLLTLSTKVAILTVLLVLVVPLFSIGLYPSEDFSMTVWLRRLEEDYGKAYVSLSESNDATSSNLFSETVVSMSDFYSSEVSYYPFQLRNYPDTVTINGRVVAIPGEQMLGRAMPNRKQNIVIQESPICGAHRGGDCGQAGVVHFDFTAPFKQAHLMDCLMILFVVIVMVGASWAANSTLDKMVVIPMERILGMLNKTAASVLQEFGLDDEGDDDEDGGGARASETELVERICAKLARLATLTQKGNVATEADMAGVDAEGKGVMMEMMHVEVVKEHYVPVNLRTSNADEDEEYFDLAQALPICAEKLDTFEVNVLDLDKEGLCKVIIWVFYGSDIASCSGRSFSEFATFQNFVQEVCKGYTDTPYHSFWHAVDVLQTTYRMLRMTLGERWLNDIDQHALLVAALCHDLGHEGLANPFLTETKHELALRYNDKSPLENMHCARLFEIANKETMNIFQKAEKDDQKQARKVCISTILHTDLVHHVEMVRDVARAYELQSELIETQAMQKDLIPQYLETILAKDKMQWMELFLHLADVSNPCKPFPICKLWAYRVLDEFFSQGDEEKRLGLPVGMLNDRDKVNRPGSQHGFINFLVAPLVVGSVKVFRPLHPLLEQMADNMHSWRNLWSEEVKPSAEDLSKRDADVAKVRESVESLRPVLDGHEGRRPSFRP